MKKYILFAMALVLSVSVFAGCAPTNTHKEVKTEIETFLTNETNQEIVSGDFNYSSKIELKIQTDEDFMVLDTLELLVNMSLSTAKNTYQSFSISPLNEAKKSGEKCGEVVESIKKIEKQFEKFTSAKTSFVANVEHLNIDGNGAKAELDVMERELGKLVAKLNNFNVAYENAYTALYGGILENASTSQQVKNAVISVFSNLLDCFIKYSIKEFNYNYTDISTDYLTNLYIIKNYIENGSAKTTNYAQWYDFYKLFKGEVKVFKESISKIKLNNFPSQPNKKQQIYKEKVESFIKTNASLFMQKTIDLLY